MKILIVEDDTMLRNWLSMLLSSLSDYQLQIYEASDGLEAWRYARRCLWNWSSQTSRCPGWTVYI